MYKYKNIAGFSLLLIVSLQALSQSNIDLKSLKKEINKTDKLLATEFAAIKFIPTRTFIMQEYEGHDSLSFYSTEKITTFGFYISPYEVTNKQYRQFLDYVQDSIMRKLMGYVKPDKDGNEYNDMTKKMELRRVIKFLEKVDICPIIPFTGRWEPLYIDTNGIIRLRNIFYGYRSEKKFISIPVMPYIESWKKDYPLTYNEPMLSNYFYHPAFDDYPVTGINFLQAQVYCRWKTEQLKNALGSNAEYDVTVCLPTASQWEAAAVIGNEAGPTLHSIQIESVNETRRYQNKPVKANVKNMIEFDCNFGTIQDVNGYTIKGHGDDGAKFTMKVDAYKPNFNSLYNIKGNVAEWTTTNGDECYRELKKYASDNPGNLKQFTDSIKAINPEAVILKMPVDSFLKQMNETKIVKGGGWTSSPFYIQPGVNQFYNTSFQHGAIGFRYVVLFKRKKNGE